MEMSQIKEHMEIFGADGQRVGTVDRLEGQKIKLTKGDVQGHGHHHMIPVDWVHSVDQHVRLSKASGDVFKNWEHAP